MSRLTIKENHLPANFKDGIRTIMLMHRKKDGGKYSKPDRFAPKYITKSIDEFNEKYEELIERGQDWGVKFRIYSSVNARNLEKGIKEYKRRQLEADFQGDENRDRFYMSTKTHFFAALMTPGSRAGKYFLLDIDDAPEDNQFALNAVMSLEEQEVSSHHWYHTPNGIHIITDPFNPNEIKLPTDDTDIKKDGMMLLAWGTPKDSRGMEI